MTPDEAIRVVYARIPQTADSIIETPALAGQFLESVNELLAPDERFSDVAVLNHRLHNLRRRGEEKGGLVRKQRRFNGRGNSPNSPR